jgi:phosphoglycerol transferase
MISNIGITFFLAACPICFYVYKKYLRAVEIIKKFLYVVSLVIITNGFYILLFSFYQKSSIFAVIKNNLYTYFNIKYILLVTVINLIIILALSVINRLFSIGFSKIGFSKNFLFKGKIISKIVFVAAVWFSIFLWFMLLWFKKEFVYITLDQLLYYALMPLTGVRLNVLANIFIEVLFPSLLFLSLALAICHLKFSKKNSNISIGLFEKEMILILFSGIFLFVTVLLVGTIIKVPQAIKKHFEPYSTFYEENYIDPQDVVFSFPEQKRNLIVLFLESLESGFLSLEQGGAFREELIPGIYNLVQTHVNFSNSNGIGGAEQLGGTGWTVAGIISYYTGIPLALPLDRNDYGLLNKEFMPGVTGLGDILADNGYKNYFILGSDSEFGGRDVYFRTHGNTTIWDYNYFHDNNYIPKDYLVWWGFEDRKLYQFAKEKLREIDKNDEPFFLTLLTVDTHPVDGYLDDKAEKLFSSQYENVLYDMDRQLNDFVEWCMAQDFYENTTIIILGDHLFTESGLFSIKKETERYPLNVFINSRLESAFIKNRNFSHFDIFPTILDAIGVEYNSKGLGLGRSMSQGEETLLEQLGMRNINTGQKSRMYESFYKR